MDEAQELQPPPQTVSAMDEAQELRPPPSQTLPVARSYQLEALEKAIKQNTIVFLEAGSGKTQIAVMLLISYSHFLRQPSSYKAVFLAPTTVLVNQQAEVVKTCTDLKVGMYSGEMGLNFWDENTWKEELNKHEVLVMTPQILLNALRHSFISLGLIKVLIFDECHNALKDHPYAQIMRDFYHTLSPGCEAPTIFGMTASPVKAKGSSEGTEYWAKIRKLENLMASKVYTCEDQSVLAYSISFPEVKFKFYEHRHPPFLKEVNHKLSELVTKHMNLLRERYVKLKVKIETSVQKKLKFLASTYEYCANELGLRLALKAVQDTNNSCCWKLHGHSKKVVEDFNLDVQECFSSYFPSDWLIDGDIFSEASTESGFLSGKVVCLIKSLLEYREIRDLRCIVFVERVSIAITLQSFLNEQLWKECKWKTGYITGSNNALQSQSSQDRKKVVDAFRSGEVNIIVSTSVLEEGLDVQSCNLVIRFDLSSNTCSFIQSRGRARMKNSEFLLMVKSGDESALAKAKMLLDSIDKMRSESLQHSSTPCEPIKPSLSDQSSYLVESTGAVVNLSSGVSLINFYCSKLPSDGYFKPVPDFIIDEDSQTGTLRLPKSSPLQSITVNGIDRRLACLEACKQLHQMGALTDHLVPDIVEEAKADEQSSAEELYNEDQPLYLAPELVSTGHQSDPYHFYLVDMKTSSVPGVPLQNVILVFNTKLDLDVHNILHNIQVNSEFNMDVKMKYLGELSLTKEHVILCRMFQVVVYRALIGQSFDKLNKAIDEVTTSIDSARLDYLILPAASSSNTIDWSCISSVLFHRNGVPKCHKTCSFAKGTPQIHTKNGLICRCMLKNSLVYTPHNGCVYFVFGFSNHLNINSEMISLDEGEDVITYKNYFKKRHGIDLHHKNEILFSAKQLFRMQNFLLSYGQRKRKEPESKYCELPPELCYVIMSPISATTFYTFSLVALIMHRIESMLVAANLQRMYLDQCTQNSITIPIMNMLEAITTKKCNETFHLESLETLGDSFLKYAVTQLLFKTHQNQHEGILSLKREKIVSNSFLCKLGCKRNIPGFIRNRKFDPMHWFAPGDKNIENEFEEECVAPGKKMYKIGTQRLKSKRVADVVEALIGAFLSCGGEVAALSFMNWIGIEVESSFIPYNSQFQIDQSMYDKINHLQSLLKYTFKDPSLLVEAMTHGSYMIPEVPRCYQRLEFLGDAVLDHVITLHLFSENPGLSPGLLTEMRSASVNNDCYAYATIRVQLHDHILHASSDLQKDFETTLDRCKKLPPKSTFGWEFDIHFPKVLADVIESLAGAIFVDSGYDKDVVFKSLKPLLEPLVTPNTLKIHPMQELQLLCQKNQFLMRKPMVSKAEDGTISYKVEVEADGVVHSETHATTDKKLAQKIASKAMLKSLKDHLR